MDLTPTAGEDAFRREARAFLEASVPCPPLPSGDTAEGFALHVEWEKKLFEAGWAVVSWPRESEVAAGRAILTVGLASMPFVADAHVADLLLLERDGEIHAAPRASVELTPQASVDGARRLFRVAFDAGPGTRLAGGEEAAHAAGVAFDRGALAIAAMLVGLARRMLDMTVEYVKIRRQFGRPIGSFQAVKHHLADALLKVEMACPVVYRAAYSVAHGDAEGAVHVSMAKLYASDAAEVAARAALQCHGAIGYTVEHDLHLWMKRAWALAAAWGDAAFHRARVAKAVLDISDPPPRRRV